MIGNIFYFQMSLLVATIVFSFHMMEETAGFLTGKLACFLQGFGTICRITGMDQLKKL